MPRIVVLDGHNVNPGDNRSTSADNVRGILGGRPINVVNHRV